MHPQTSAQAARGPCFVLSVQSSKAALSSSSRHLSRCQLFSCAHGAQRLPTALQPTLGAPRQAASILCYATPWNKEGSSMQVAVLRAER